MCIRDSFCTIPLVFVGVVAVMLLTGKTFNFVAIVGTLGLIGMIIKNGTVLMDEITLQISKSILAENSPDDQNPALRMDDKRHRFRSHSLSISFFSPALPENGRA